MTTDQLPAHNRTQQQVTGLPAWYFVLAGLLVASFDISEQFRSNYPVIAALPLVLIAVHITLWFGLLSRRRQYLRSVWRTPRARLLVVLLFGVRLLLQLALTRAADAATPLHSYPHLIMGLVLLVLSTTGAWFDQWLILRTVNKRTEQTKERQR